MILSADGGDVELRSSAVVTTENAKRKAEGEDSRNEILVLRRAAAVPVDSLSSRDTADAWLIHERH